MPQVILNGRISSGQPVLVTEMTSTMLLRPQVRRNSCCASVRASQPQSIGPCVWVPLPGQSLIARQPKTVKIVDIGSQDGANYWYGLTMLLATINAMLWSSGPWIHHQCDDCCKTVIIDQVAHRIQAAVIDGITATRSET